MSLIQFEFGLIQFESMQQHSIHFDRCLRVTVLVGFAGAREGCLDLVKDRANLFSDNAFPDHPPIDRARGRGAMTICGVPGTTPNWTGQLLDTY
jgi:hypothetical protein